MIYIGPVFQSSAINFRGKAYISEKLFDSNMSQIFFLFFFFLNGKMWEKIFSKISAALNGN